MDRLQVLSQRLDSARVRAAVCRQLLQLPLSAKHDPSFELMLLSVVETWLETMQSSPLPDLLSCLISHPVSSRFRRELSKLLSKKEHRHPAVLLSALLHFPEICRPLLNSVLMSEPMYRSHPKIYTHAFRAAAEPSHHFRLCCALCADPLRLSSFLSAASVGPVRIPLGQIMKTLMGEPDPRKALLLCSAVITSCGRQCLPYASTLARVLMSDDRPSRPLWAATVARLLALLGPAAGRHFPLQDLASQPRVICGLLKSSGAFLPRDMLLRLERSNLRILYTLLARRDVSLPAARYADAVLFLETGYLLSRSLSFASPHLSLFVSIVSMGTRSHVSKIRALCGDMSAHLAPVFHPRVVQSVSLPPLDLVSSIGAAEQAESLARHLRPSQQHVQWGGRKRDRATANDEHAAPSPAVDNAGAGSPGEESADPRTKQARLAPTAFTTATSLLSYVGAVVVPDDSQGTSKHGQVPVVSPLAAAAAAEGVAAEGVALVSAAVATYSHDDHDDEKQLEDDKFSLGSLEDEIDSDFCS